jgi:hypothetical protein
MMVPFPLYLLLAKLDIIAVFKIHFVNSELDDFVVSCQEAPIKVLARMLSVM